MTKKLTIFGLTFAVLSAPWAAQAHYFLKDEFISDRLTPGGMTVSVGGVPVLAFFYVLAALVTVAFIIFWTLMLVDCLRRVWPGKWLWLALLIVSLPLHLYPLTALAYYLLVKMEADRVVGWRQRTAAALKKFFGKFKGLGKKR